MNQVIKTYHKMAGNPSDSFLEKLKSYSNNESFSDIVICYEDTEFKAHTVILSCHSEYFAKQPKESIEKVIHIIDFDSSVIEAMLHFIYHFEYTNESKESAMVFHAKVYQIADKYGIFVLKEHAKQKFRTAVKVDWSTEDFSIAIELVYTTTPPEDRGLRDLIVETSNANLEKLISRDGFCEALRTTTDFAADLVPFTCGKGSGQIHCYRCPSCGRNFQFDDPKRHTRYCPRCGWEYSRWDSYIQIDGKPSKG
ncbi:hypothetical protein KAF25_003609 [Fusarium avenaceum]|uniref:BTB domain-containing protein n=1 Tax=Fusarium avenaceum TaxID=40199 RepID=A0A9P7H892_9HYPO|nr:hypothetical protein KAF25_003609 [Fusarium avenaceum]